MELNPGGGQLQVVFPRAQCGGLFSECRSPKTILYLTTRTFTYMQASNTEQAMRLKEQARVHLREVFALTQISYVSECVTHLKSYFFLSLQQVEQ